MVTLYSHIRNQFCIKEDSIDLVQEFCFKIKLHNILKTKIKTSSKKLSQLSSLCFYAIMPEEYTVL